MSWRTRKIGVACFVSEDPILASGHGDASEFPDSLEAAHEWVKKALLAGRFNYFVIWERNADDWYWQDEYKRSDPKRTRLSRLPPEAFGKSKVLKGKVPKRAPNKTGRPYTKQEVKELRTYAKARMPLGKIAKALKRPEGGILQKAAKLKIKLRV